MYIEKNLLPENIVKAPGHLKTFNNIQLYAKLTYFGGSC